MFQKLILLFCVFLTVLVYTVNTEKHEYVVIEDYPYHVSIQIAGLHVCSGAFIHESWIMTAASCVFRVKSSIVSVRVRSSYTSKDGDVLEVDKIEVHENFDKYEYLNDIALMKLKSPAEFGEKLLPIGLPENEKLQDGSHCVVTGWKRTRYPGATTLGERVIPSFFRGETLLLELATSLERYFYNVQAFLQELGYVNFLQLPANRLALAHDVIQSHGTSRSGAQLATAAVAIVNQRTCEAMMPSYKPLSQDMLCANATRPSERCQDDLGAPLVSEQMLIGILSYGLGCETRIHPDVYTRVSSYLSWILTKTGIFYK